MNSYLFYEEINNYEIFPEENRNKLLKLIEELEKKYN